MNRQMKRAAKAKGKGAQLQQAMNQVQNAVSLLSQVGDIPQVVEAMKEHTLKASGLADALVEDYEALQDELRVHEQVIRDLIGFVATPRSADGWFKEARERLQREKAAENEG